MTSHGEYFALQSRKKVRCESVCGVDYMGRRYLSARCVNSEWPHWIIWIDQDICCGSIRLNGKRSAIFREKGCMESRNEAIRPKCSSLISYDAVAVLGVDLKFLFYLVPRQ